MRRCGGQFARSSGLIGLLLVTLGAPRRHRSLRFRAARQAPASLFSCVQRWIDEENGRSDHQRRWLPRDLSRSSKGLNCRYKVLQRHRYIDDADAEPMKGGADSAKIPTYAAIPSSFSISAYTFWGVSTGSFWVPGDMPSTDNAHLSTFDVSATNFENATGGAHFVHMLLASSNSNIDADYNGKGMIFGPMASGVLRRLPVLADSGRYRRRLCIPSWSYRVTGRPHARSSVVCQSQPQQDMGRGG